MSKTSYKNIDEVLNHIDNQLQKLQKGKLELSEIDALVEAGRELNERLIILRYKAYQEYGDPKIDEKTLNEEKEIIEEVLPEKEVLKPDKIEENTDLSFDFTGITTVNEPVVKDTLNLSANTEFEQSKTETKISDPLLITKDELADEEVNRAIQDNSLNQLLKSNEDVSLRDKLGKNPISDIKTHISIAQKFEYISHLFNGENNIYEEAIQNLNTCENAAIAQTQLETYADKYKWDKEDKTTLKFITLIERRYY